MHVAGSVQGQLHLLVHLAWLPFTNAPALPQKVTGRKWSCIIYGRDISLACSHQGKGKHSISVSLLPVSDWTIRCQIPVLYFSHICLWKKLKLVICLCLLHLQVELLKWSSTSSSTTSTGTACWGRRLSLFLSWSLKMTPATLTVSQKHKSIKQQS